MNSNKKHVWISLLIATALIIAFSPVFLTNNYVRQDDLMWGIWPGMRMKDFGYLYRNAVFELVRPICMIFLYYVDVISFDIIHAVYFRIASVIMLCMLGIMLYRWQLLFNSNRLLAASFAVASLTLPAFQVYVSTANYYMIIAALLMTIAAAFCFYYGYHADQPSKKYLYIASFTLLFASLLDYPLSTMYVWVLIAIAYLNKPDQKKFIKLSSLYSIGMMVFYYLFCRLIHKIFHVHPHGNRTTLLDTSNLSHKIRFGFDVLGSNARLWFWDPFYQTPIIPVLAVFFLALMMFYKLKNQGNLLVNVKHAIIAFAMTLIFFFISFSPVLLSQELSTTFRYAITTMPLLLYIMLWSFNLLMETIFRKYSLLNKIMTVGNSIVLVTLGLFSIYYANIMLADGIVGPHQKDFASLQKQLAEKVIPLIEKNQQVVIHAIACDKMPISYPPKIPAINDYSMRICQFQQQVIGAIFHSLKKMGYVSNHNRANDTIYNTDEIVVKDTPWGTLVVNSVDNTDEELRQYTDNNRRPIITIDMRKLPAYEHLEFYRGFV